MRAGLLRSRVTLQQKSTTPDAYGQPAETWSTVATVWAYIEPLTGREPFLAKAPHTEISHQIVTRYQSLFADPLAVAALRAVYNGRNFNILACLNTDERNSEIRLLCSEGLNTG